MNQLIRFPEWLPDVGQFGNPGLLEAKNVVPWAGGSYKAFPQMSVFSNALDSKCLGGVVVTDYAGNPTIYAGDAAKLYGLSGSTFSDKSKAGGYNTAGTERWKFSQWGNQVFATNFSDEIQKITAGGSQFANLTSEPRAKHIAVVRHHVVVGNTWDSTDGYTTYRVWWSAFEDPTSWTPSVSTQCDYQDLAGPGGGVQGIIGGEAGTIFLEHGIWRMTYVGAPYVFQFDEIEPGRGAMCAGGIVNIGPIIFFLSHDGFYVMYGSQIVPISEGKVNDWFFSQLDTNYNVRMTAVIDPTRALVMWSFTSNEATNGNPDKIIVYNWIDRRWSWLEFDHELLVNLLTTSASLEDLDTYGTLETLAFSLDSKVWIGGDYQLAAFDTNHKLNYFQGNALYGKIETSDHQFTPGNQSMLVGVRPICEGQEDVYIQVGSRNDLDTVSWGSTIQENVYGVCPCRVKARYHRIRFEMCGDFQAIGYEPDWNPSSRR